VALEKSGNSSVGRASASQAEGRGFESRFPLKTNDLVKKNTKLKKHIAFKTGEVMDLLIYWIIAGLLMLLLELIIPGVVIGFFGVGALLAGLIGWIFDIPWQAEVIIFIVSSLLLIQFMRKYIIKKFNKKDRSGEIEDIIGAEAVVAVKITPQEPGKVQFRTSLWKAESDEEIEPKTRVRIIGKRSIVLIVKPL
jgi:inner membrane protein